ncbi:MAG: ABC transporter permease subunit [Acidobacteriota bacterium]
MAESSFTGRRRERRTSNRVLLIDHLAKWTITVGGLSTIGAVLLVCFFLAWVVVPLFGGGDISEPTQSAAEGRSRVLLSDEYRLASYTVDEDGRIALSRTDTGELLAEHRPLTVAPTAFATGPGSEQVVFGFPDGRVQLVRCAFVSEFLEPEDAPDDLALLEEGAIRQSGSRLAVRTPEGQIRFQGLEVTASEPLDLGGGSEILLVDHLERPSGSVIASYDRNGQLRCVQARTKRNLLTGKTTTRLTHLDLPAPPTRSTPPSELFLLGLGDALLLLWPDGTGQRYDLRDRRAVVVAESLELVEPGRRLTAAGLLNGRTTLVVGDDAGGLSSWFLVKPEETPAPTTDGAELVRAHEFPSGSAAITALAPSVRSRLLAVGDASGTVRVVQATTEDLIAEASTGASGPVLALAITPKDDGLLVRSGGSMHGWSLEPGYPEATLSALFRPVWYEGYEQPTHAWQSSSGTDDFEMKLGLWPLIFGTLKATLYSMLFGAPLALLAAIYTSEFLGSAKAKIKPTIELMASLPSVVLGFLAALVIAPVIEQAIVPSICVFFTVPFMLLLGARLWQLLPSDALIRFDNLRPLAAGVALPLGMAMAFLIAPLVEKVLFAGDVLLWLDGQTGSGGGGWVPLLLPLAALLVVLGGDRVVDPILRERVQGRSGAALADLLVFLAATVATLVIAFGVSQLLAALGWDPRGLHFGTYVQRNAMIVGFVMGFAIIPIIYTIADDALSAVPEHLRSASLGCGATRWQTARYVIIPTAMSGLFSALMVGLGRAVGETMIVLMAAGNTPVMEWNIFNGFRTLSANIAVELPEAVQGSTHYRTLFLAALVLFAMTFVLNTVAELVRIRFRRRAFEA